MYLCHRDHGIIGGRCIPADQRLQCGDQLTGDHDGIITFMGTGCMTAGTGDSDPELIYRCCQCSRFRTNDTGWQGRVIM